MVTRIYVDRGRVQANKDRADGALEPCVILMAEDGAVERAFAVDIAGPSRVRYAPPGQENPASVWVETEAPVLKLEESQRE